MDGRDPFDVCREGHRRCQIVLDGERKGQEGLERHLYHDTRNLEHPQRHRRPDAVLEKESINKHPHSLLGSTVSFLAAAE